MNKTEHTRIQKDLFYREYVQRENDFLRAPYNPELEFYSVIKSGDVDLTKKLCSQRLMDKPGLGTLSKNELQNLKYHFTITTAMVARYCIEGGMDISEAYGLSDFYIEKADCAKSLTEVSDLHPIMCMDYTKRMKNLRKKKVCSLHVANCLDYIYDNLHTRLTLDELAQHLGIHPSYLSRLFKNEMGMSVSEYILNQKINTAQNMLIYSNYSPAQIASTLAFSSQSYFTEVFHKKTGLTPAKYRTTHFRKIQVGTPD